MVDRPRFGWPPAVKNGGGQAGSALVIGLALAVVLTLLASTITARTIGYSRSVTSNHNLFHARVLAEEALYVLARAIEQPDVRAGWQTAEWLTLAEIAADAAIRDAFDDVDLSYGVARHGQDVGIEARVEVHGVVAVATAQLRPRLSSDFVWLTEFGVQDPIPQGHSRYTCAWPVDDPRRASHCVELPFPLTSVDGPVHSNERLLLEHETDFLSVVSSADAETVHSWRGEVELPRDPGRLVREPSLTCRLRGPTLLRFDGISVRIRSPHSAPRPTDTSNGEASAFGCLGVSQQDFEDLVVVELPASATILIVEDDADECTNHPLGIDAEEDLERSWRCDAGDAFVWGRYEGKRTVIAQHSIQIVSDIEPGTALETADLQPGNVLGLVAGNSVIVRRPIGRDPLTNRLEVVPTGGSWQAPFGEYPLDAPHPMPQVWDSPRIVAAVAALRGSFSPQNALIGEVSTQPIVVHGSLAGRFAPGLRWPILDRRDRVIGWRVFGLDLRYDERLDVTPPPWMPEFEPGSLRIVTLDVG